MEENQEVRVRMARMISRLVLRDMHEHVAGEQSHLLFRKGYLAACNDMLAELDGRPPLNLDL